MATHKKNTVDYFPFICAEGKKMYYLEETYGNDGFATFVKILRELANTEFHFLDLSKISSLMFLSAKCKVNKETLEKIINDLVELGKFNEHLWTNYKVIWCQDFIDSIQDAYKRRSNQCADINTINAIIMNAECKHDDNINKLNENINKKIVDKNPQTIVNYSKLNKTRENNASAIEILKEYKQEELDVIWMQNKKQINDSKKLVDSFNAKMELELAQGKITFEPEELMPRFKGYVIQWVSNTNHNKTLDKQVEVSNKPKYF